MAFLTPAFAGGSFAATRDVSVNFGSNADRGCLVLVFSEGVVTAGGTPITSCVIDPAGANLAMTAGTEQSGVTVIQSGGKVRAFWLASSSVPTGAKTIRVTCADGNGKPQVWALPFDGYTAVSAESLANGGTTTPAVTVASATGATVAAMVFAYAHPDTATMAPAGPATLVKRVLVADNPNLTGAMWQEAGASSVTIDGTWSAPSAVWGVVGWSLTPSAGGSDTTPPVITGPSGATGSTATISTTAPATAVHTYSANESVVWSLNGGANVGLFGINSSTGALAFNTAPTAGTYVVGVRATDGSGNATTQTLTVTVAAAGTFGATFPLGVATDSTGATKRISQAWTGYAIPWNPATPAAAASATRTAISGTSAGDGSITVTGLPSAGPFMARIFFGSGAGVAAYTLTGTAA